MNGRRSFVVGLVKGSPAGWMWSGQGRVFVWRCGQCGREGLMREHSASGIGLGWYDFDCFGCGARIQVRAPWFVDVGPFRLL